MAVIKTKLSRTDLEILDVLDEDDGSSPGWLASEVDLSESGLSHLVTKLRGLALIVRHRNLDGDLMIYRTPKGSRALEKSQMGLNPGGVTNVAKFSVKVDDDLADDIREIAAAEGKTVGEFLTDLTRDGLDEFYPEEESELEEEE